MSGGALVWFTDNELARLLTWYDYAWGNTWYDYTWDDTWVGPDEADDFLHEKLQTVRKEVACKVPDA